MAAKLTENQRKAVECTGRPLFIQAGAGTGKTFTLTKKLAYGLSPLSGPIAPSVERILIITFTKKAAGELLGRVRAELRANGLSEAALAIDGAWISTIHSMCQSLLAAHALEAHVDPATDLLAEEQSLSWLKEEFDRLLGTRSTSDAMLPLIDTYGLEKSCTLVEDLALLIERSAEGLEGMVMPPRPQGPPAKLAASLSRTLVAALGDLEVLMGENDVSEACAKQAGKLREAASIVQMLDEDEALSWSELAASLASCPIPKGGNLKKTYRETFALAEEAMNDALGKAVTARSCEHLELAVSLAQGVAGRHAARKRAQGVQDLSDLLTGAYRLLRDNPALAQAYAERFCMVMVDEFQDTDPLQVKIVGHLCDGPLDTLTTVGDAQQSIYGFRGADLETYREVRAQMASVGSLEVELDTNYRSHPDILAFVESIFAKQAFFGDEFLRIQPGPANVRDHPWAAPGEPRVTLMVAAGEKGEGRARTSAASLRAAEAAMIAERFERLHAKGAGYGEMAILLRSTKKAGVYLDALRERGIPCATYGGSDFYGQPEVKVLTDFLAVLMLPDDDEALLRLLASPMFDLPDDELLLLRRAERAALGRMPEDVRRKNSLYDALMYRMRERGEDASPALGRAAEVLSRAVGSVGSLPVSQIIERAVAESGWVAGLQREGAQGAAAFANIRRFEDLVDSLGETGGPSIVDAAAYFADMRSKCESGRGVSGKPGRMVNRGSDAVLVMTIHASKGLEFPIVAVAQYASGGKGQADKVRTLTEDGNIHLVFPEAFSGADAVKANKSLEELAERTGSFANAKDSEAYVAYASHLETIRQAQEEQRLLYVALTRARDMLLLVSSDATLASTGVPRSGLFADVVAAILPQGLPDGDARLRLDTGCLLEITRRLVPWDPYAKGAQEDEEDETYTTQAPDAARRHMLPAAQHRLEVLRRVPTSREILSYSALSQGSGNAYLPVFITLKQRSEQTDAAKFGSAFHLVAEWMAANPGVEGLEGRIAAAASRYGLDDDGCARLRAAAFEWAGSERLAQARAFMAMLPEYPFCIRVGDVPVEGFIDLLCLDEQGRRALIIDYKTGVSGEGAQLEERYIGQARTYALAVMKAGLSQGVDVVFVRPEAGLQEVVFSFDVNELSELEKLILE